MIKILGTGSYLPPIKVTNEELEKRVDTNAKWIEENLGIKERRIVAPGKKTSDIAVRAGWAALENSGVSVRDIDLLIVATATPDMKAPSTACLVQDRLGCYNAVCFDINAVCSGFLYALHVATSMVRYGGKALVIGADTFSRITDWERRDCVFFGDGAGAAVVSCRLWGNKMSRIKLYSDPRGNGFSVPGEYFKMKGSAVYDTAINVLPKAINEVLKDAGLTIEDVDLMIPHQPSIRILQETAKRIGLPWEKVMTNMDKYANTSAGTIPILLDEVNKAGKLKGTILLAAVGSGWTWGAAIIEV
jgi:3-oxoacyl-[acyl-carrier-protein] synthase-3